ncbi:ATP-binding protein [Flammeovirga sp. EKP202]|uniref:sensor histidine kinase n=1 Tax=Flammeovirga sp. EKP202 TaxID=2770592 RepID=UPI00165F353A|nr:GAF domain-containing sensor histidine kinase [Flammeovirga sp. EKP202]MBD0401966.1 GAF domain-containing sensor histidine kinase [Flammeovirga sp. EKP202]
MKQPVIPHNEKERLEDLKSYAILDSLNEDDYDNLTKIASEICGTPISLVSLVDDKRQWFKSSHGIDATETPKEIAFCAHAINEPDELFIVPDSREDERFYDNPLVVDAPNVIFYAGVPLVTKKGNALGTLCVIDHKPKVLTEKQKETLSILGNQVMQLMELRKSNLKLKSTLEEMSTKNKELERFAYVAAHDLKSPLCTISGMTNLLKDHYSSDLDENAKTIVEHIHNSSDKLKGLIDGILSYSKSSSLLNKEKTTFSLEELKADIDKMFNFDFEIDFTFKSDIETFSINRTAIDQILINLISNAIKYNDKAIPKIEIMISEDTFFYHFIVKDNGPGIPISEQDKIFEIFNTATVQDRFGEAGNGIGLATVKNIINSLNGKIKVNSDGLNGTQFVFCFKK